LELGEGAEKNVGERVGGKKRIPERQGGARSVMKKLSGERASSSRDGRFVALMTSEHRRGKLQILGTKRGKETGVVLGRLLSSGHEFKKDYPPESMSRDRF